jgi:hypothetical protein
VALLVAIVAALFWPGMPMYDTVAQYGQVLSNEVDDWHPPVMVRLWQALEPLGTGTAPIFVLQVVLYAAGFGLIVAALGRSGRWRAALAAAVLALSPLLLAWQMVVLKDAQMLGALLAACGIIAQFRFRGRRIPLPIAAVVALLLGYATLVRANALFATVPLSILLLPRPRKLAGKVALGLGAIVILLAVTPILNQRLFRATESGVANSQPLFDIAAIAVATPDSVAPFTHAERAQIIRKHCVKSFFWDPVGDPSACGPVTDRANALPERELYLDLARAAASHPLAYAVHRLKHWNSTERWLVPPGLIDAEPPDEAEENDEGLKTPPSPLMPLWQGAGAFEAGTPLGWPILWTAIAVLLLPSAWRRRGEAAGGLALALIGSALVLEASFFAISIASDLRYHLWPMTAAALALILLGDDLLVSRRAWTSSGALLALVVAGGLITRTTLPHAPDSYQAMLHAPSG